MESILRIISHLLFLYLSKYQIVFVQISNCICPNIKIYLSKYQNVFVQISKCIPQISKCICPIIKMYSSKSQNVFVHCYWWQLWRLHQSELVTDLPTITSTITPSTPHHVRSTMQEINTKKNTHNQMKAIQDIYKRQKSVGFPTITSTITQSTPHHVRSTMHRINTKKIHIIK